jgi:hypothetical protein
MLGGLGSPKEVRLPLHEQREPPAPTARGRANLGCSRPNTMHACEEVEDGTGDEAGGSVFHIRDVPPGVS